MQRICAIIPARGGSKRIPRKNITSIAGIPLIGHSILQAKQSPSIDTVIVSTDDAEISQVAERFGARVILRPAELASDSASSESALLHVLDALERESYIPEAVVFLQATSPLRAQSDLEHAIELFQKEAADSLFSARSVEGFLWRSAPSSLEPVNYDPTNRPMRQAMRETMLEENGSIYIFTPHVLRAYGSRLGGRIVAYPMSPLHSLQIDNFEDIGVIDTLFRLEAAFESKPDLDRIRLLVFDFDGVFTDNRVLVSQDGSEAVWCNRSDGLGIARLHAAGIKMFVISTETNPVVAARCRKLKLECIQSCSDKLSALRQVAISAGAEAHSIAYVGNDWNDTECMQWVGLPIAVNDAAQEVKKLARLVTTKNGGEGAIHEIAGWFLNSATSTRAVAAPN